MNDLTLGQVPQLTARVHITVNQFEGRYYNPIENADFLKLSLLKVTKHVYNMILFHWVVFDENYASRNAHLYVQIVEYGQGRACKSNG